MATAKQIQHRLRLAKKTVTRLNKEQTAAKSKVKKLEAQLQKAKTAKKATTAKKKRTVKKRRPAARKKTAAKKKR